MSQPVEEKSLGVSVSAQSSQEFELRSSTDNQEVASSGLRAGVASRTRSRISKRKRDLDEGDFDALHSVSAVMEASEAETNSIDHCQDLPGEASTGSNVEKCSRSAVESKSTRKKYQKVGGLCSHSHCSSSTENSCSHKSTVLASEKIVKEEKSSELSGCECGVCLEPVKERGLLDTCGHMFCFNCVYTWAKRSSSCPHCKREINSIAKSDVTGKIIRSRHPVTSRTLRDTLDREEFLRRQNHLRNTSRQRNGTFNHSTYRNRAARPEAVSDQTQQLLAMHHIIRDNMTRMSSYLNGMHANLNNLSFLNLNRTLLSQQLEFCNFPTVAANINVTVNGTPVVQPSNIALSGYGVVDNSEYLPPNLFHYHLAAGNLSVQDRLRSTVTQLRQLGQLEQQLNTQIRSYAQPNTNNIYGLSFAWPPPAVSTSGVFPAEVGQSLNVLARLGQAHLQRMVSEIQTTTPQSRIRRFPNNPNYR